MKIRALLTSLAAAFVCCCTLGCPPAEDATTPPADTNVETPADSNATE